MSEEQSVPAGRGPLPEPREEGRVLIENHWPNAIWYLKVIPKGESRRVAIDVLRGALMPGASHVISLPPGTYRLVAESGNGSAFESPVIRVRAGGTAHWTVAGDW